MGETERAEQGARLSRLALTRLLVAQLRQGEAIIAGIGNTNFDLAAAAPGRPENFYMLGSMGQAASIALGVALLQPARRVFAPAFLAAVARALHADGPHFIAARIDQRPGAARPERDPVVLKERFMRGLGVR